MEAEQLRFTTSSQRRDTHQRVPSIGPYVASSPSTHKSEWSRFVEYVPKILHYSVTFVSIIFLDWMY